MARFHVKHGSRHRRGLFAALLFVAVALLAACSFGSDPDGWAAPVSAERADGQPLLLLSAGSGALTALALDDLARVPFWQFPDGDGRFPGLDDQVEADAFYGAPAPLGADEVLLAGYDDGLVYAVRTDGSSARLIFDAGARLVAGVVVDPDGHTAYVATTDNRVYALDTENPPRTREDALWLFGGLRGGVWGTPHLLDSERYGQLLLVPSLDGSLYALRTGAVPDSAERLAWRFDAGGALAGTVVGADGLIYVGSFDRNLYAVDVESGEEIWAGQGSNWFWATLLVAAGAVYAADMSGLVRAWDARSGESLWERSYDAADSIHAQPLLMPDGTLLVVTRSGTIHAINGKTGEGRWVAPADVPDRVLANPILRDDVLLLSNDHGLLFEVRVDARPTEIRQIFPPPALRG